MTMTWLKILTFSASVVIFTSCAPTEPSHQETLLGLAAAQSKVSAAVHSAVRYKEPSPDLADSELLDFATAHNPNLLNAFKGYVLKARQDGRNSSVLLCDAQGQTALIEDAGCTSSLDQHIWKTQPGHACGYVIDLAAICPPP
ncbi:MAG: hypothetical protein JKY27_09680 [Magnetovibrio sp.]|nr:hypothetical protein [Magnetovibrio sp.]